MSSHREAPEISKDPVADSTASAVHSLPGGLKVFAGQRADPRAVIGVWTSASRRQARIWDAGQGTSTGSGPFRQVSRLGSLLVNEVLIPLGKKNHWNAQPPVYAEMLASYVAHPRTGRPAARSLPRGVPASGPAGQLRDTAR